MPSVLIAGDICPIGTNKALFQAGEAGRLFNDLLVEFKNADLVVANLECPLIEKASPIPKTGPSFGEPGDCINGIKKAGIDILSLANNHILDHGPQGLQSTILTCQRAGIATVGAGATLDQARRILVLRADGLRIGFLSVAEHEFSIATKTSAGANPLDLIDLIRHTRQQRADYDYLIVLLHGADEFQPISPCIQNTCRFLVEMGANAVVVQHPHVLGGWEAYRGGHIVYGQGALLMDEAIYRNLKAFHEGFLVKLNLAPDAASTLEIIPFTQSDPEPGARRLTGEKAVELRKRLEARSAAIADPGFVEAEWVRFCEQKRHGYLSSLLGHNRLLAKLNKGGLVEKVLHGKMALLRAKNVACCETHREAIQTLFERRWR